MLVDAGLDVFLSLRGVDRANFDGAVTTSGTALTRADGKSWASVNGFAVGDLVQIVGGANAGTRRITAISGSVLTLDGAELAAMTSVVLVRTEITVGIDHIQAGRDLDLELRTGVRNSGRAVDGEVNVIVPNEVSIWQNGELHSYHFRGTEANPDPAPAGVSARLDPAVFPLLDAQTPPKAVEVQIDSRYRSGSGTLRWRAPTSRSRSSA